MFYSTLIFLTCVSFRDFCYP